MTNRIESKIPFVGLHAHSGLSPFDGLGMPGEHMDFAYENGCDALALTDHGNANGLSHQVLHAKKMKEQGKAFKPIFGCEAYFIPSVAKWKEEYEEIKSASKKKSDYEADNSGTTVEDEGSSKKRIKSVSSSKVFALQGVSLLQHVARGFILRDSRDHLEKVALLATHQSTRV